MVLNGVVCGISLGATAAAYPASVEFVLPLSLTHAGEPWLSQSGFVVKVDTAGNNITV
jgi:hypothetical protein